VRFTLRQLVHCRANVFARDHKQARKVSLWSPPG
jgi:hypothetical protein